MPAKRKRGVRLIISDLQTEAESSCGPLLVTEFVKNTYKIGFLTEFNVASQLPDRNKPANLKSCRLARA